MEKIFLTHTELIAKLEKTAGITFSKKVTDLYYKFGYKKMKLLLIYMKQNNLKINNLSIRSIFIGENHLRHILMPRVESFEVILKNHMLHEIARVIGSKNIIEVNKKKRIFKRCNKKQLIKRINNALANSMKIGKYKIEDPKNSIFDWIHHLMFGNTLFLFNSLRPEIQRIIFRKAFDIRIKRRKIKKELEKVRFLRNKIAHAEQIFFSKGMIVETFNKEEQDNYPYALKNNINRSFLKGIFKNVIPYIDDYLDQFNKYK